MQATTDSTRGRRLSDGIRHRLPRRLLVAGWSGARSASYSTSRRAVMRLVPMKENSRLICLMIRPVTKMRAIRSSSAPASTINGMASVSSKPNMKMFDSS